MCRELYVSLKFFDRLQQQMPTVQRLAGGHNAQSALFEVFPASEGPKEIAKVCDHETTIQKTRRVTHKKEKNVQN